MTGSTEEIFEIKKSVLSEFSHDLKGSVVVIRSEAQLGLLRYEKVGDHSRAIAALQNIIGATDELIAMLEQRMAEIKKTKSEKGTPSENSCS